MIKRLAVIAADFEPLAEGNAARLVAHHARRCGLDTRCAVLVETAGAGSRLRADPVFSHQTDLVMVRRGLWDIAAGVRLYRWLNDYQPHQVAACGDEAEQLLRKLPRAKYELMVLTGVPLFEPIPAAGTGARRRLRRRLHLDDDALLAVVSAPLEPASRLKDALWACDLLQCVRDDVYLVVLGRGAQKARLQQFAEQAAVHGRTFFLGRPPDSCHIIAACDVYWECRPALFPSPAMLVALSAGVPVVAAHSADRDRKTDPIFDPLVDLGGIVQWIEAGQRQELARATLRLWNEQQSRPVNTTVPPEVSRFLLPFAAGRLYASLGLPNQPLAA